MKKISLGLTSMLCLVASSMAFAVEPTFTKVAAMQNQGVPAKYGAVDPMSPPPPPGPPRQVMPPGPGATTRQDLGNGFFLIKGPAGAELEFPPACNPDCQQQIWNRTFGTGPGAPKMPIPPPPPKGAAVAQKVATGAKKTKLPPCDDACMRRLMEEAARIVRGIRFPL
jgi:hypothetical protein